MGLGASSQQSKETFELPSLKHTATLYYFSGRGLADQIRWMLAATNVSFTQKSINTREKFLKMAERQLPFGQLPLLQIDDLEIVQSQAAVRYLAKRGNLLGTSGAEQLKCDVIAETVKDFLKFLTDIPFIKVHGDEADLTLHLTKLREKWDFVGGRLEIVIATNENPAYLVGNQLTYADILVAHLITWITEEAGPECLDKMPKLVDLQCAVMSLPQISEFIKSIHYFPVGDAKYVSQVERVLGRKITK